MINDLVFYCYKKRKTKLFSGQIIQKKELITKNIRGYKICKQDIG